MEGNVAAIYVRVSTIKQVNDGYSLDIQEKELKKWCIDNDYDIYKVYSDRGKSGKDIYHRADMKQLLIDAKESKFNTVLFWDSSRISRNVSNLFLILDTLKKCNISIRMYKEPFDSTTPMGRAMIGFGGIISQLQREITGERVSYSMRARAEKGKRTCSGVLGYDLNGKDSLVINSKEAEYVKFCFDQYLIRKNLTEVAQEAKKRGYVGKRGKKPTPYSIQKIITRPIYCGYNSFCGETYKGDFEGIIDINTFNKAQKILLGQGKITGRKRIKPIRKLQNL